jgi:hypothetical protein
VRASLLPACGAHLQNFLNQKRKKENKDKRKSFFKHGALVRGRRIVFRHYYRSFAKKGWEGRS